MDGNSFHNLVFTTANLNDEDQKRVLSIIKKHGGIYKSNAWEFDYLIYDDTSEKKPGKLEWAYGLLRSGKPVSIFTVADFCMLVEEKPVTIEINGYSKENVPEIDFPEYDPPVYYVEEIDVSGKEAGNWIYEICNDCIWDPQEEELWIKDYRGKKKQVIVPVSVNGRKVTGIADNGFQKCQAIEIKIPGSLKIGTNVGIGNEFVKSVTVGEGCERLGSSFFMYARALNGARISRSVSEIDASDIYSHQPLYGTGWYERELKKHGYVIAGSVMIDAGDIKSERRIIPKGVKAVNIGSLINYHGEVIFPDTVTTLYNINNYISDYDIYGLRYDIHWLNNYVFPESLKKIEHPPQSKVAWVKGSGNHTLLINHQLYQCSERNLEKSVLMIPDGTEGICTGAVDQKTGASINFKRKIKKINFPDTLEVLMPCCFKDLMELEVIELPETVKEIGEDAFSDCLKLSTVIMPEMMRLLDSYAFRNCFSLKKVVLPSKLEHLGKNAFFRRPGYYKLPDNSYGYCQVKPIEYAGINVPAIELNGVKYYRKPSDDLLRRYKSLLTLNYTTYKEPEFPADMIPAEDELFTQLLAETGSRRYSVVIQINKENENGAVYVTGCGEMSGAVILYKYLGNEARIVISDSVTMIAEEAFSENRTLKYIDLNNVSYIGKRAFRYCSSLEYADLSNARVIGEAAFADCGSLKQVVLGAAEQIGAEAFSGCDTLTISSLPDTLRSIGDHAFTYICDGLVVPKSVTNFGVNCFGTYDIETDLNIYRSALYHFREYFDRKKYRYGRLRKYALRITVLDDRTDAVTGCIPAYCNSLTMCKALYKAFGPDNTFDYSIVDNVLFKAGFPHSACNIQIACLRLEYPFDLSETARKSYAEFLRILPYRTAMDVVYDAIHKRNNRLLAVLCINKVIEEQSIEKWIDISVEEGATECTAVLLNYRRELFEQSDPLDEDL